MATIVDAVEPVGEYECPMAAAFEPAIGRQDAGAAGRAVSFAESAAYYTVAPRQALARELGQERVRLDLRDVNSINSFGVWLSLRSRSQPRRYKQRRSKRLGGHSLPGAKHLT